MGKKHRYPTANRRYVPPADLPDVSFWSIERALSYSYVMEPHVGSSDFSGPKRMSRPDHECAVRHASYLKGADRLAKTCAKQCAACEYVAHMNDYIRGKPHCPPHYPLPAIYNPCYRDYHRGDITLLGFFVALG